MSSYLFRRIMIGVLFGMPAGMVGAMTVQRTLNYGIKAGLLTGLGFSVADCFYACVGVFGLTMISDLLLKYSNIVNLLGGALVMFMGFCLISQKKKVVKNSTFGSGTKLFLSSFTVGITNQAAILTFLFAFSWFGISGQSGTASGILLVCGVFIGTYIWWGALATGTGILKKKVKENSLKKLNGIFGVILMIFGTVVLVKTVLGDKFSPNILFTYPFHVPAAVERSIKSAVEKNKLVGRGEINNKIEHWGYLPFQT